MGAALAGFAPGRGSHACGDAGAPWGERFSQGASFTPCRPDARGTPAHPAALMNEFNHVVQESVFAVFCAVR
jgi:hypothetical protein